MTLLFLLFTFPTSASGVEKLDRGLIALQRQDGSVFLSWRLFDTDPQDITFQLKRCGDGKQIAAVKAPANKSEKPAIVWKSNDRVTTQYVPTGLYKAGLLYTSHDAGTIACRRADTGKILWSEKPAGKFYGSPVWVDGKIYCITREGDCVVFQAGPEYKLLAINSLGEASDATPAIANGKMYLRTKSKLMCLAPTGK